MNADQRFPETRSAHRAQPELLQPHVAQGDLMTWNQRPGPSGSGPRDGWMRQFLRGDAERRVGMLTALRKRLERDLAELPEGAVPGKEWCRVARLYQDGYRTLAALELETVKVRLRAEPSHVRAPMTDEQFEREIRELGAQVVLNATDADIETWLAPRAAAQQGKAAPRGRA